MNNKDIKKLEQRIDELEKKVTLCLNSNKTILIALHNQFETLEYIIMELEHEGILPQEVKKEDLN